MIKLNWIVSVFLLIYSILVGDLKAQGNASKGATTYPYSIILKVHTNTSTYKIGEKIVFNYSISLDKKRTNISKRNTAPYGLLIMKPYLALDYHMQCNDIEVVLKDTCGNTICPVTIEGDNEINPGIGFIPNKYLPESLEKQLPEHNEFWPKPIWLWDTTQINRGVELNFGKIQTLGLVHQYNFINGKDTIIKDTLPIGRYVISIKYFVSDNMCSCWPQYYIDNYGKPWLNVWKGAVYSNEIEVRIVR